jgi:hypothetical protein
LEVRQRVDPQHLKLGCAPSKNAYGELGLAVPDPRELEVRFAGAHMHFGAALRADRVVEVVKLLDAIAGVAMVAMGEGYSCPKRREYYGRAGEYRWHGEYNYPYRLEYRVPDTLMLSHPATFNAMWDFSRVVFKLGAQGLGFLWDSHEDEVRECINKYDVKLARKILKDNGNMLDRIIDKANPMWGCSTEDWRSSTRKLLFEGIGSVVGDVKDVCGNWWLDREEDRLFKNVEQWWPESYSRKPAAWHTGKIWSSAAMKVVKGERV